MSVRPRCITCTQEGWKCHLRVPERHSLSSGICVCFSAREAYLLLLMCVRLRLKVKVVYLKDPPTTHVCT